MAKDNKSIPAEMTIAEASEFWDEHSAAEYPSHIVELEYQPDSTAAIVAIARDLTEPLRLQAKERGISVETLVNLWVQEKLLSS